MNPKKVYAVDPGFTNRIGFNFSENKGRILENIVFLELLRQGKDLYYYSGKNECDFLVKEGLKIVEALQVSYHINAHNEQREYEGLQEAMLTYNLNRGVILTYDTEDFIRSVDVQIEIIPVWKWLLTQYQKIDTTYGDF